MLESQSKAQKTRILISSLVSNENFSKILPASSWALGRVTSAKAAKNLPHLWCHSQKTWNPKPKTVFHCNLKDLVNRLRVWTALL